MSIRLHDVGRRVVGVRSCRGVTAAVVAFGLLIGGFVFAPGAFATTTTPTTSHPSYENAVLSLLNQERAAHHLPALHMNSRLLSSAHGHNVVMATKNLLSHQCSGEKSLGDRIDAAHYNWSTVGENVGWDSEMTSAGAQSLQQWMYNEKAPNDPHRQIILAKEFVDVGISVVTDSTHQRLWLTEDFGHLR